MMTMTLRMNLSCRLTLLQELGLKSDYFENVLVRTERQLQQRRNQRGLKLLKAISDGANYRGVIDLLLALCSPVWAQEIQAYYDGHGCRLIEHVDWTIIEQLDQILAQVVVELAQLYAAYEELGWREGRETVEYDEVTREGLRWFVGPKLPMPPERVIVRAA